MLSWATPLWLLGLTLLPAIRWLHRGGRHRQAVPVSRLGLWRASTEDTSAAAARRPPDPAWRRRALLTALVFAALAEPQWPDGRTLITLWVDDSLSMLTREPQGTRLALGLARARERLDAVPYADVELRSLGDPWRKQGTLDEATIAALVAAAGRKEPTAPPAALLRRDRQHWLLTDGADAALTRWPGGRQADRVIQTAGVTRNAGLTRLSARRSLEDPQQFELLLELTNGGTATETRELAFIADAGVTAASTQRIEPGAALRVSALIAVSDSIRARLQPADALAEDDEITLDLTPLRRQRVAADSSCPAALLAALQSHPALSRAPENATDVAAVLDCGKGGATSGRPTLRVLADRAPTRAQGSVQWSSAVAAADRVALDPQQLQVAAPLKLRPSDTVMLAVGDAPVIVSRGGSAALIETSLDFESMGAARAAELPLLLNLMLERVLGRPLLDAIAMTERGAGAARVVPAAPADTGVDTGADTKATAASRPLRNGTWPLLVAAVLVLLWEVVALGRQWFRLSAPVEARSE